MMSTRSARKRASATPGLEGDGGLPAAEEQIGTQKKKRQRQNGTSSPAPTSLNVQDAAAAAAEMPARTRQPRVQFNQQEADSMTQRIQELEAEAQESRDRAHDLGVPDNAINEQVARAVRFMLFKNFEKPDVPVKRQEIVDALQKDQAKSKQHKKLPTLVLAMAAGKLASAFGLELLELKRTAGGEGARTPAAGAGGDGPVGAAAAAATATQTYALRSLLPKALQKSHNLDAVDDAKRALMSIVAALLMLAGGQMEIEELWRHLGQLGAQREAEANEFGRKGAAEVLVHMEKARYIVMNKVAAAGGGQQQTYSLGENAADLQGPEMKAMIDRWLSSAPGGDGQATEGQDQ